MTDQFLDPDEQAIILLCSSLTQKVGDSDISSVNPLSPREWHLLVDNLIKSGIESPSMLLEMTEEDFIKVPNLSQSLLERILALLKRGGQFALEIEHLSQLGIWVMTEYDDSYPNRFSQKLKEHAPPVLFGAGDKSLLLSGGLAIVGSRNVDERGAIFTERIAKLCTESGINVISGAARGVDGIAMTCALRNRGSSVGILADSLERFISNREYREFISEGFLAVVTHAHPRVNFSIPLAMSRNKYIYALSDYTLVVSSDIEKGGTWAGAIESLKNGYTPIFVRDGIDMPSGNKALIEKKAIPFPEDFEGDLSAFLIREAGERDGIKSEDKDNPEQMQFRFF